jgi:1-phosphofructokinase family hexose kinase
LTSGTGDGHSRRSIFVAANPSIDRLWDVDRLEPGLIHRPSRVVAVAGGKGLNAARAAARLAGRVSAVALLGGRAGEWIAERLVASGIDTAVARSDGETRTCVSVLDRATGELTEFYEPGEPIGLDAWAGLERAVAAELERGDAGVVVLSGSLPPGAPEDGYGRLVRLVAAAPGDVVALVDAHGAALEAALHERPAFVKLNAAEAAEACGLPATAVADVRGAVAAARRLLDRGPDGVVVTLGAEGAVVADGTAAWALRPPAIRGAYPVGSGDAVAAGLSVALARGEPLVEAARLGIAAGVANALVPGAVELDPAIVPGLRDAVTVDLVGSAP